MSSFTDTSDWMEMDLDDFFEDEEEEEEENEYLSNREKGLALIRKLLLRSGKREADRVGELIDRQLMPWMHELEKEQKNAVNTLQNIRTQAAELSKISVLNHRSILGVGGKFSAGKSCFINSLTEAGLPEGQRPTTSIATYIVQSDQPGNYAITVGDSEVELDDKAVEALTHEFSDRYGISFSRVIENLVIRSKTFKYPNIVILDTPGYSKSDQGKNADATDEEIALHQLGSADALIWLMDIENGVINESDLSFLENLRSEAKILFVFNKADLRLVENARKIVAETKQILQSHHNLFQRTYAVIAYSSWNGKTIVGEDELEGFLKEVGSLSSQKVSLSAEATQTMHTTIRDIDRQRQNLSSRIIECEKVISMSKNPQRLTSVIREMGRCRRKDRRLADVKQVLSDRFQDLIALLKEAE